MSRLLAIEWDVKEARVVAARKRGLSLVVEQLFTVPLPQREEGSAADPDVGGALAKALAQRGLSRGEALVAVGRSSIELRFLSTPPVPPDELPELVRFQALKQFSALGDDWPLDFVPLSPNADGGSNVLAATIPAEAVTQIKQTATAAGFTISRLVLRPFAAASLLQDQLNDDKCRMVVDLLKDDADLTVLFGPQVIFPRTVRLPAVTEAEVLARVLVAEGRRTMIAAQNQLGGRRVDEVVILGDGEHHTALKQLLEKDLALQVRLVDPLDHVEFSPEAKANRPEFPGTFAPLFGMLRDETAGRAPLIDFLHPRKKPEPPNRRRLQVLIGGAIAAILLLGFAFVQMRLWSLDDEIAELKKQRVSQEKLAKASIKPAKDAETLDQFAAGDVTWLDELSRTSLKFPGPQAARLQEFHAAYIPKTGAKMTLSGLAAGHETIRQIEDSLRDKQHTVFGAGGTEDPQLKELKWRFDESVIVLPPGVATAPQVAAKTAPKAAPKATKAAPAKQGGAK